MSEPECKSKDDGCGCLLLIIVLCLMFSCSGHRAEINALNERALKLERASFVAIKYQESLDTYGKAISDLSAKITRAEDDVSSASAALREVRAEIRQMRDQAWHQ